MPITIAVAGAGLAGMQHINAIRQTAGVRLAAIIDPGKNGKDATTNDNTPLFDSMEAMTKSGIHPNGIVIATPTTLHPQGAKFCAKEGIPMLIEKPIANDSKTAAQMVEDAEKTNTPMLIGHHRRHNPTTTKAREIIQSGALGKITAIHAQCWLSKPEDYFTANDGWRKQKTAGPLFINAVHDIDILRHLCAGQCGDIVAVQAMESRAARGFAAEDTAVLTMRFAGGALATMTISDAIVAPWSWELTARENPVYPNTAQSCYHIGGADASLSLPDLTLWQNPKEKGWWQPITATRQPYEFRGDSMLRQITHFAAVIQGKQPPIITGEDGIAALKIIEAAKQSATTSTQVNI